MDRDVSKATASDQVRGFYDEFGWKVDGEASGEDKLFRTFPVGHTSYAEMVAERTREFLVGRTGSLLIVGCGDMPATHMALAAQFSQVACMDISRAALDVARERIGKSAEYILDSIVSTEVEGNAYDAILCAHVLYHIDASEQELAVKQMIRLLKPGGRILLIYANPSSPFALPGELVRGMKARIGRKRSLAPRGTPELYYHAHRRGWWRRFSKEANIFIWPWEVIGSRPARALLRGRRMPSAFFRLAAIVERKMPRIASRFWQYQTVVIDKPISPA